jgi:hypothetical protein
VAPALAGANDAHDAGADAAVAPPPAPWPAAAEAAPPPPAVDPNHARREALFDVAFQALVAGELDLAKQAFQQAAALPGDPVQSAVAASFAERVRRMRRAALPPFVRRGPLESAAPTVDETPPAPVRERDEGRVPFLATTTLMGLTVYGWTLPSAFGVNPDRDTRAFIGLYMLTAGASFVVPYLATMDGDVTPAQANLAFYGATRGLWHGLFLASVFGGDITVNNHFQAWSASLLLGSAVEMAVGYGVARSTDLTPGTARTIAVGGDFGLGWGLAMGAMLGLHHDDHSADAQARGMAAAGLVGTVAGVAGGWALAERRRNTWGDGEVLRAAGLLGLWLGFTADLVLDWDPGRTSDEKKAFATLMVGGAVGLGTGDVLVQPTDFSVSESLLIDLATITGGLATAGLGYLFTSGSSGATPKGFAASSAIGAVAGFALSYWGYRDDAIRRHARASRDRAPGASVALVPTLGAHGQRGLALAGAF